MTFVLILEKFYFDIKKYYIFGISGQSDQTYFFIIDIDESWFDQELRRELIVINFVAYNLYVYYVFAV